MTLWHNNSISPVGQGAEQHHERPGERLAIPELAHAIGAPALVGALAAHTPSEVFGGLLHRQDVTAHARLIVAQRRAARQQTLDAA
jgi:hypothetical protein